MPSPHFDARNRKSVTEFLDRAAQRLTNRSTKTEMVGRTIREIYGVLSEVRRTADEEEWRRVVGECRQHELAHVLREDQFTHRAYSKPRGYAGDAVLLDFIYGAEQFWSPPEMSWIGQRIHRWTTISSACEGVKARRGLIAEMIDQLSTELPMPHVLSLAAGHMREAEISSAIIRRKLGRLVAIDSDRESLNTIENQYSRYGVETIWASARELIQGKFDIGTFDFIYTSGLYDYLNDSICKRLTATLFSKLNPGGKLLVTNFLDEIEGVGYMEAFMDWNLIYRNRIQMMSMTERIPEREVANISAFSEENYNVIFLCIERSTE